VDEGPNKGMVIDGKGRVREKVKRKRKATCLVLPAYKKFHTPLSCDAMSGCVYKFYVKFR
jgi:hypothetical protein